MVHNSMAFTTSDLLQEEVEVAVLYWWLMFRHFITQWLEVIVGAFNLIVITWTERMVVYVYSNSSLYELGHYSTENVRMLSGDIMELGNGR